MAIDENVPKNTINTKKSVWNQFTKFCKSRNYSINAATTNEELNNILKDWGFNMRKNNGEDYKETAVKTFFNITAKLLQEKFFNEYNRKIDPFTQIEFKGARDAKNTKRKELQKDPDKRKVSSSALSIDDIEKIVKIWNEETPEGLQRKFYHIAAYELAWRGGEATRCKIHFFKEERNCYGILTNRIEYNPIFSKTCQGGSQKCTDSKWLTSNSKYPEICPVRLYRKLLSKRSENVTSDRLFLTINSYWKEENSKGWFKNSPIGPNTIGKWTKEGASKIGLNVSSSKITNHSNRSSAVSNYAKAGIGEQQLCKMTGHANTKSLTPYLQLDQQHHATLVSSLRNDQKSPPKVNQEVISTEIIHQIKKSESTNNKIVYNNCTFNVKNMTVK